VWTIGAPVLLAAIASALVPWFAPDPVWFEVLPSEGDVPKWPGLGGIRDVSPRRRRQKRVLVSPNGKDRDIST
jgi:hypothetical protein